MRLYDETVNKRDRSLKQSLRQIDLATRATPQWSDDTWRQIGRAGALALSLDPVIQAETGAIVNAAYDARLTGDTKHLEDVFAATSKQTLELLRGVGPVAILEAGLAESRREYEAFMKKLRGSGKPFPDLRHIPEQARSADIPSLASQALSHLPSAVTLREVFARLEDVEDDNRFEEAVEAALLDVEPDSDLASPATEEELSSRQALMELLSALRPDLTGDPDLSRKISRYAGASSVVFYGYLYYFQPDLFVVMRVYLEMFGLGSLISGAMHKFSAPKQRRDSEEQD
ncbi:hypothetical protein [Oerskovia rustica]|uniref:Uncharacterized protein n=1 Tax=Oerskovia rustica TaxID=2762237 RepID=A0ABR8RTX5_9CELL|nr:hypothetical protein [Oerskovia rustica]MBD7951223.1 hypothetical protein [Oerskovia rustica]